MRYTQLLICTISLLFFDFSCEPYCEAGNAGLSVALDVPGPRIELGDTIWLSAAFDAQLDTETLITESGGNMLTYLLAVDTTSGVAIAARNSFDVVADNGNVNVNREGLEEPAGLYWTYACPAGNCAFNIGLVPRETGLFLMEVNGLGYSVTSISRECRAESYVFNFTDLEPTSGIADSTPTSSMTLYTFPLNTINQDYTISSQATNTLLFKVE